MPRQIHSTDERDLGAFIPAFLDDYGLNSHEFRIYSHIARRAGSGQCWESIEAIANHCCMDVKTARKAIALLTRARLLRQQPRSGLTNLITLTHHREWADPQHLPSLREELTPTKSGRATKNGTPTKSGTTPLPNQEGEGVPNQEGVPLPNQVPKGTPIEGTPIEGTPSKDRAREKQNCDLKTNACARTEARYNRGAELQPWEIAYKEPDPEFIEWMAQNDKAQDNVLPPRVKAKRMLENSVLNGTILAIECWKEYQDEKAKRQQREQPQSIAEPEPEPLTGEELRAKLAELKQKISEPKESRNGSAH